MLSKGTSAADESCGEGGASEPCDRSAPSWQRELASPFPRVVAKTEAAAAMALGAALGLLPRLSDVDGMMARGASGAAWAVMGAARRLWAAARAALSPTKMGPLANADGLTGCTVVWASVVTDDGCAVDFDVPRAPSVARTRLAGNCIAATLRFVDPSKTSGPSSGPRAAVSNNSPDTLPKMDATSGRTQRTHLH